MNAVVLTVKASYVASTKYQKVYGTAAVNSPVVSWKMKAPEKKPLVKRVFVSLSVCMANSQYMCVAFRVSVSLSVSVYV